MQPFACSSPSKPFRPHGESPFASSKIGDEYNSLQHGNSPLASRARERGEDSLRCHGRLDELLTNGLDFPPARNGMSSCAAQDLIVVVTSVGTEEQALDIAHALVRNRQAACVNLIPNIHSIYRWKGRVCDDGEYPPVDQDARERVSRPFATRSRRSTPTSFPRSSPTASTRRRRPSPIGSRR